MKQIVFPDYFRTDGKALFHSEMGDFYGKQEHFKLWHWLVRNFDKRVPDYVAYAEQYRWKNKERVLSCNINLELSRCELGKTFVTDEFVETLLTKVNNLKKRYLDSLNGVLKNIRLVIKVDPLNNIVELNRLIITQYTFNADENINDPSKQWVYKSRTVEPGDFSYRFSPYLNDSDYWDVTSKKYLYFGVTSFGVSQNRAKNAYRSLNKYITYVTGELREWLNSIKYTRLIKNEIKNY